VYYYTIRVSGFVNNRNRNLPVRFRFIIAAVFLPLMLHGQLTAPGAGATRYTTYPSMPGINDPVFIYCSTTGTETGTLTTSVTGGGGPYTFSWLRWNETTDSFSDAIKTDAGVSSSTINNLTEGGYKVEIDSAGIPDTSYVAWIVFDQAPYAEAKLLNPIKNCNYVALDGDTASTVASFPYYDPGTGIQIYLSNELSFIWSSEPESTIPHPETEIDPITFTPPLEDLTYKLTVNSLACSSESSFFYESIHVDADFTFDPSTGEAPLEVTFTDQSIRGYKYYWDFGDSTDSDLQNPEPHIYYKPGEYTVLLIIESDRYCKDSLRSEVITVEPSSLAIPNVFTPDGDPYNDRFMVESKSLRYLSIEIFSRSGLKVYAFSGEGENLRNWTGWDGNINNTSVKAQPGVYFYIIRALGWDDITYDGKEYRGFLYLYR
jgi:gliding motility-associated-like protein